MKQLLDGRLAPITHTIGFIKCVCKDAVDGYLRWQEPIQCKRSVTFARREVGGSLADVLRQLLPLTSVESTRFLFIPTSEHWTAYFDNDYQGTDAFPPLSYLAEVLKCIALRATVVPHDPERKSFGATILELYGPTQGHFLNYIRSIAAAHDGKKWAFSTAGDIQPFEQTARYDARSIQDRFTPEMLDSYLQALGIRAFDEDFYLQRNRAATILQKLGPSAPGVREFQLEGLRRVSTSDRNGKS